MQKIAAFTDSLYQKIALANPKSTLILLIIVTLAFSTFISQFKLDASAESLVLENDESLQIYREMNRDFTTNEFLVVTFEPMQALSESASLATLQKLHQAFQIMPGVSSVNSILNVPIVELANKEDVANGVFPTINSGKVDAKQALKIIQASPLYNKFLLSDDGRTTAIQINLIRDETYYSLLKQRNVLNEKKQQGQISEADKQELATVSKQFSAHANELSKQQRQLIEEVRLVMNDYRDQAQLFLGGVPMIANDMIDYVRSDLLIFGITVTLLLIVMLAMFFASFKWVLLPIISCAISSALMLGLIGFLNWPVTVISSNFISLLLIMTLAINIHLIVRYQELHANFPERNQMWLVKQMVNKMAKPCFYTGLTTIIAFGSLVVSGIRPVIDFGMMMVLGVSIAFFVTFLSLPCCLLLLPKGKQPILTNHTQVITLAIAHFIQKRSIVVILIAIILCGLSVLGMSRLSVDNRFIDYFKTHTEIFQGMQLIDQKLGGTTPLDIIIKAEEESISNAEEDDFADDGGTTSFWLNQYKLADIERMHNFLDALPETGKVLSLATSINVIESIPGFADMSDFELALLPSALSLDVRRALIDSYYSVENEKIRINVRLIESNPELNRNELFEKITDFLTDNMQLNETQFQLTGMAVLYNNMLQSLFQSQILTIGAVFLAIMAMFIVLFRSIKVSIIAIVPNLLAAGSVLGFMGLIGTPLDMMTITIAAITVGIAVDDTIHYIHRFRSEFPITNNYWQTVQCCHMNIGRAIYYTSIVVIIGFSILVLSNFIPTVYFGLLTSFAMLIALLGALTLLPMLIVFLKPFGKEIKYE